MLALVSAVIAIVCGYLLGSIPVADLVARRHGIDDLRAAGDHNPGFWNTAELLGWRPAFPVFVGDVAKGAAAAGVGAGVADGRWWLPVIGTGAAMVGHAWPISARFRGGRSVLAFVGGAIVISPAAAVFSVTLTVLVWAVSRRFEWAARAGIFGYPVIQLAVDGTAQTAATGALMTLIGLRFAQASLVSRASGRAIRDGV